MNDTMTVRIYCGGRPDVYVDVGDLVYESVSGTLYELTSKPGTLWTDSPRGNYRRAEAVESWKSPTDLSEAEFDDLYSCAVE